MCQLSGLAAGGGHTCRQIITKRCRFFFLQTTPGLTPYIPKRDNLGKGAKIILKFFAPGIQSWTFLFHAMPGFRPLFFRASFPVKTNRLCLSFSPSLFKARQLGKRGQNNSEIFLPQAFSHEPFCFTPCQDSGPYSLERDNLEKGAKIIPEFFAPGIQPWTFLFHAMPGFRPLLFRARLLGKRGQNNPRIFIRSKKAVQTASSVGYICVI